MGSHVKYKHDSFVKRVSRVNPNMIRTRLTSTYDLFINRLVVSCSQVVSNFVTPIDMVELEERLYIYIYIYVCIYKKEREKNRIEIEY